MSYTNYFEGQTPGTLRPRKQASAEANWLDEVWKVVPRRVFIAGLLALALLAFELFNFDTTRYALSSFLGEIRFLGIGWASILAIAFCAIDFAGLVRVFTPETGREEPKEVWYLMGAWLLGATLNAIMTWWAVNLALLNHTFGNEVLGREQLLRYVPIFVAVLVWLTRILFIGSLSVAGEKLLGQRSEVEVPQPTATRPQPTAQPRTPQPARPITVNQPTRPPMRPQRPAPTIPSIPITDDVPDFLRHSRPVMPIRTEEELVSGDEELVRPVRPRPTNNRVRNQPPNINRVGLNPAAMQAKSRR
jgi:hypothetical protein